MSSSVHCPFLYQTRTLLRHQSQCGQTWKRQVRLSSNRSLAIDGSAAATTARPSDGPPSFLQQKARDVVLKTSKTKLSPVMTVTEKSKLEDIWRVSNSTPLAHSSHQQSAAEIEKLETDFRYILSLFQPISRQEIPDTDSDHRLDQRNNNFNPDIDSRLLKSHENAIESSNQSEYESSSNEDSITAIVLNILSDISSAFDQALKSTDPRPDHAIWAVCEAKVFPLIKLLTPPRPSLSSHPEPTSTAPPQSQSSHSQLHPQIPPQTPLLPLLTQLYPSALLLALRLLKYNHPSSPYNLALLPHIKSLGPTSYVLGVNTHFYNTLLSLRWNVYSDFRSIEKLLAEMERNGVDFDTGTHAVLRGIGEDRMRDIQGDGGERGRMWWERREIVKRFARVEEWRIAVARKLEEIGLGEVMREGGDERDFDGRKRQQLWYNDSESYGRRNHFDHEDRGDRGEEEYVVTL